MVWVPGSLRETILKKACGLCQGIYIFIIGGQDFVGRMVSRVGC